MRLLTLLVLFVSAAVCSNIYAKPSVSDDLTANIVTDMSCPYCMVDKPQETIRYYIPKATFKKVDYRSKAGQAILKKHNSAQLPLITLSKSLAADPAFKQMEGDVISSGGEFLLKPQASGIFMFLNRSYVADQIDYFFDFYDVRTAKTFPVLWDFCKKRKVNLNIVFVVPTKNVFGYPEQEIKSALAVQKLYPQKLYEYLTERINFIETIDCTTSLGKLGMDFKAVSAQFDPNVCGVLFKNNAALINEIGITNGNAILVNNQRLFMIFEAKQEDFAKVLNKK